MAETLRNPMRGTRGGLAAIALAVAYTTVLASVVLRSSNGHGWAALVGVHGPAWRMPAPQSFAEPGAPPALQRQRGKMGKVLAAHPTFVQEWHSLAAHFGEKKLVRGLLRGARRASPPMAAREITPRGRNVRRVAPTVRARTARLMPRSPAHALEGRRRVQQLVRSKRRQMVTEHQEKLAGLFDVPFASAGDDAHAGTGAEALPAEHGALNGWVLHLKPRMDRENSTWGEWRTPDNSNQYTGMTEAVPNTNPLGEQVIDEDSDKLVNITDVEKGYGANPNPLFAALEGQGLPKMFTEQDVFAPCSAEERAAGTCTPPNSQPNHPVRDAHSDPRELEGGEHEFEVRHTNFPLGSAHDSFRNCSDPNLDEHYEAPCDPVRNQYGRPVRPGGFPDEPMIVERRIHEHSYGMRNAEQVQPGHPIPRANISVYVEDHHPYYPVAEEAAGVYPRTEFPIGMMKEPYTATGGYGGLAGPPFLTQETVGSEVSHAGAWNPGPPPPSKDTQRGAAWSWSKVGLGDGYEDAQRLVGVGRVRDAAHRWRWGGAHKTDKVVYHQADQVFSQPRAEAASTREAQGANAPAPQAGWRGVGGVWRGVLAGGRAAAGGVGGVAGASAPPEVIPRVDKASGVQMLHTHTGWGGGDVVGDNEVAAGQAGEAVPLEEITDMSQDLPGVARRVEGLLDPLASRVRSVRHRQSTLGSARASIEAGVRRMRRAVGSWRRRVLRDQPAQYPNLAVDGGAALGAAGKQYLRELVDGGGAVPTMPASAGPAALGRAAANKGAMGAVAGSAPKADGGVDRTDDATSLVPGLVTAAESKVRSLLGSLGAALT